MVTYKLHIKNSQNDDSRERLIDLSATGYLAAIEEAKKIILDIRYGEDRNKVGYDHFPLVDAWRVNCYLERAAVLEVSSIELDIETTCRQWKSQWDQSSPHCTYNSSLEEKALYERLKEKYEKVNISDKAVYCGHANEMPVVCPCPEDCYCHVHGNCGKRSKRG